MVGSVQILIWIHGKYYGSGSATLSHGVQIRCILYRTEGENGVQRKSIPQVQWVSFHKYCSTVFPVIDLSCTKFSQLDFVVCTLLTFLPYSGFYCTVQWENKV